MDPENYPCEISDELQKFLTTSPRLAEIMKLTTIEESGITSRAIVTKLLHYYLCGPEYNGLYFSETNVDKIAKRIENHVRRHGFPLHLTFDEHSVLVHYFHRKTPKNFDTKTIRAALASVAIASTDPRKMSVMSSQRVAANDYMVNMLPKTFKMLKTKGVVTKDMPFTATIEEIVVFNCKLPSDDFTLDRDTIVAHIKEVGFPLEATYAEHEMLIRILHDMPLQFMSIAPLPGLPGPDLRQLLIAARKGKIDGELMEKLQIEYDAVNAYHKSLQ